MKKLMLLISSIIAFSITANALSLELSDDMNELSDGQVLAVIGWINAMPGPPISNEVPNPEPAKTHDLAIRLVAYSSGCTAESSFEAKLQKVNSLNYSVVVTRTQPDFCEAVGRFVVLTKKLTVPVGLIQKVGQGKVKILAQPTISVGIAY